MMQFAELEAPETLAVAHPLAAPRTETLVRPLPVERGQSRLAMAIGDVAAIPWPLFAVLGIQAILSVRLIWSNTAFLDEATYIWAGRIELWHLTNGMPVPPYATYFSGAPVIYPPLAGLADIVGGLAGARLLSLAFMLGATCLLWGSARRLFGRRAALGAVAVFASIGSTQYLGSLATFDAMALFLLALSAWLVIAARDRPDSTWLLMAAAATLALANATKYATGLFDPVVVGLAILISPPGIKAGIGRGGMVLGCTIGLVGGMLAVAGSWYMAGLQYTTLSRPTGNQSPVLVMANSARWIGLVVAVAAVGVVVAWRRDRGPAMIITLLAAAGLLAPLNQARIHTMVSLNKHVDFGAWFCCMAAGYAVAAVTTAGRRRWARIASALLASAVVIYPAGAAGRAQAYDFMHSWPDTTQISTELFRLTRIYPGKVLAEDYVVPAYYLESQLPWQDWASTWYFLYRAPGTRACIGGVSSSSTGGSRTQGEVVTAFTEAVEHRYFSLIVLDFGDTYEADQAITGAIRRYRTYHVIAELPWSSVNGTGRFTVWAPTPSAGKVARGSGC